MRAKETRDLEESTRVKESKINKNSLKILEDKKKQILAEQAIRDLDPVCKPIPEEAATITHKAKQQVKERNQKPQTSTGHRDKSVENAAVRLSSTPSLSKIHKVQRMKSP
jgi:hypothetical protein